MRGKRNIFFLRADRRRRRRRRRNLFSKRHTAIRFPPPPHRYFPETLHSRQKTAFGRTAKFSRHRRMRVRSFFIAFNRLPSFACRLIFLFVQKSRAKFIRLFRAGGGRGEGG